MSKSELLLNLAFYVVPAISFFGAAYYFTNKWFDIQKDKLKIESNKIQQQVTTPIAPVKESANRHFLPMQVDAYQRLVLFLERIAPNNMVMRLNNPGLPAAVFQAKLLETVREEFEHNLAQQIFVSPDAWNLTKNSKEEVSKIINMASTNLPPTAMATDLARAIFEITAQLEIQPTDRAIGILKDELNKKMS